MKIFRNAALASLVGAATLLLSAPASAQVSFQFRLGTRDKPLQGRQFETMRALSHYLDVSAQDAIETAGNTVRKTSRSNRQFLRSLDDFARRADSFHERMDQYETRPWDLPREVVALDQSARRVNDTIRRARIYSGVAERWGQVVDTLDRMKRVLAGEDVRVPAAHRHGRDYDRDYGPFADNRDPRDVHQVQPAQPVLLPPSSDMIVLNGRRLDEYRQLARDLEDHSARTLEIASRMSRDDREYSQDLFLSLQKFSTDARTQRNRTDQGQIDRKDLNRLLSDAHESDRRMREGHVFPRAWEEWKQCMTALDRMIDLIR
ncbi:MAG: hypothetical protein ABIQ65_03055 [Thermoanaerobaculia bacterium]